MKINPIRRLRDSRSSSYHKNTSNSNDTSPWISIFFILNKKYRYQFYSKSFFFSKFFKKARLWVWECRGWLISCRWWYVILPITKIGCSCRRELSDLVEFLKPFRVKVGVYEKNKSGIILYTIYNYPAKTSVGFFL